MLCSESVINSLKIIRDVEPISARSSAKGSLINELFTLCQALSNGLAFNQLREEALNGRIFIKNSFETRRSIWNHLKRRYLFLGDSWVIRDLVEASNQGIDSNDFLSLSYLYYVLRDNLTYRFITGPVWNKWTRKIVTIEREDVFRFFDKESERNPQINAWYESTKKKVANNTLSSLRDFRVLSGVRRKRIQHFNASSRTVLHLLSLLIYEGLKGENLIQSPDWHMFLWSEGDVVRALNELSHKGFVKVEKGDRSIILEIVEYPWRSIENE